MPQISFTSHLQRHVDCKAIEVDGTTVQEALNAACDAFPKLRGYILDEVGRVRRHIMIFVDNEPLHDRERLGDPVDRESSIYVMQALSGG